MSSAMRNYLVGKIEGGIIDPDSTDKYVSLCVCFFLIYSVHVEANQNPLHPYINMQILHTVLYTSLMRSTRRLCLVIISFIVVTPIFDSGLNCKEKLDASHC